MKSFTMKILFFIICLLGFSLTTTVFAADLQAKINITADKTEVPVGEYVTFNFAIQDIVNAADNMVTAAEATITYDKNFFEVITEDDVKGMEINIENGKMIADFKAKSGTATNIGSVKLKLKTTATGSGTVKFSNLSASDGEGQANTNDIPFTIKVATEAPSSDNGSQSGTGSGANESGNNGNGSQSGTGSGSNESGNNDSGSQSSTGSEANENGNNGNASQSSTGSEAKESGNNGSGSQSSTDTSKVAKESSKANSKLPYTGGTFPILSCISIFVIIAIISYKRYIAHKYI